MRPHVTRAEWFVCIYIVTNENGKTVEPIEMLLRYGLVH